MPKNALGIYIGEREIICTEVKLGGTIVVEKLISSDIPEGAVSLGVITDIKSLAKILRNLLEQIEVTTDSAVTNIPPNLCGIKIIPEEPGYEKISNDQISWEMSYHMNEPQEELITSYQHAENGIILSAARKDDVIDRGRVLEDAGLFVESIQPQPIADFNLVSLISRLQSGFGAIVVHIDYPYSHVTIFDRGRFFYGVHFFTDIYAHERIGETVDTARLRNDILDAVRITLGAYLKREPAFRPTGIIYIGKKLDEAFRNSLNDRLGFSEINIEKLVSRTMKIRVSTAKKPLSQLLPVVGLSLYLYYTK